MAEKIHVIKHKPYFYAFLLATFILGAIVLWPVRDLVLMSLIVVTLFRPVYLFFRNKLHLWVWAADLLAVLTVLFTVLFPLSILFNMTIGQFEVFYHDINAFLTGGTSVYQVVVVFFERINAILEQIPYFEYRLTIDNLKLAVQQNLAPVANHLLAFSVNIGLIFVEKLPLLVMFIFVLWYGFPEYESFLGFVRKLSPLPADLDDLYLSRITATIRGIVNGTFIIAAAQAIIAGISLWLVGVPYVLFWTVIMFFMSIVPLGSSFVVVPIAIIFCLLGGYWQAAVLIAVQFGVTSNIDNILRPMLVPKEARLHPVLLLLSFIGGIQIFGVWGFLYGPLIMVVMITSFQVLQKYYKAE